MAKKKEAQEKHNWFDIWFEDKKSILEIMRKNMASDLDAGYDPNGHSIRKQVVEIEEYQMKFDQQMDIFRTMEEPKIQHWCYYDLKKRGVIE